ncbi:MAG: methyltransferase domain-containing protein [Candidatus Omnitrophica bacterium]|nr:methyltransferase domain-containing protein [Candidatus Omnitrophota bacterium]MDD5352656.1 methyltransferase domain-containing protein [Candidatus Omnitrophota bacterium]MDD5550255.1 methyltransferase domain-containing protein [Candidatus Omnitrophota bacterium]
MRVDLLALICCPKCGSDIKLSENYEHNGISINFGKLECINCRAYFLIKDGIPILIGGNQAQKREKEERDELAKTYLNASSQELLNIISHHHHISIMKRRARIFASKFNSGEIMCDIGIGWGWHWIGIRQPNIIGVDFSFNSLQIAKKLLEKQIDKNVHLICADASSLPLKNKVIEGVWSVQSLQHLPPYDLITAFTKIKEVLKEYRMEIYWVNYTGLVELLHKIFNKTYPKTTLTPYFYHKISKKELVEIIKANMGIQETDIEISYNETLFNPDLKIIHNFNIWPIDVFLGKIPFINSFLGRQITAKINV